jgi:hypothetical protein
MAELRQRVAALEAALAATAKKGGRPRGKGAAGGAVKEPRPDGARKRTAIKTPKDLLPMGTAVYNTCYDVECEAEWAGDGLVTESTGHKAGSPITLSAWAKKCAEEQKPASSNSVCSRNGWDVCYTYMDGTTKTYLTSLRATAIKAAQKAEEAAKKAEE